MAEIKKAVIAHANADSTVFGILGNRLTADRVPDEQAYPNGRVWTVTSPRQYFHGAESGRKPIVQIDIYAETIESADSTSEAVRALFSGYSGMLGDDVYAGYCKASIITAPPFNEEARNYHRIIELEIGTND